jgi:hypothetical protein
MIIMTGIDYEYNLFIPFLMFYHSNEGAMYLIPRWLNAKNHQQSITSIPMIMMNGL